MNSSSIESAPDADAGPAPALSKVATGRPSSRGLMEDELSLHELWRIVWSGRLVILASTLAFSLGSIAYAFLATEWYRAEVLLQPSEQDSASSIVGQLGGLASLVGIAGLNVGTSNSVEAAATLRSREIARSFIEDHALTQSFFADDWDESKNRWRDEDEEDWPDIRDAVKYFQEEILSVKEDRKTSLVTLGIEWTDPEEAAQWADELVRRVNDKLRSRALQQTEDNLAYLRGELAKTDVVTLQQSIGQLLENELQRLMMARGNEEFAFRVIDPAQVPKERAWPKRVLIVALGTLLGGALGLAWVFLSNAIRTEVRVEP